MGELAVRTPALAAPWQVAAFFPSCWPGSVALVVGGGLSLSVPLAWLGIVAPKFSTRQVQ